MENKVSSDDSEPQVSFWPPGIDIKTAKCSSNRTAPQVLSGAKAVDILVGLIAGPFVFSLGLTLAQYFNSDRLASLIVSGLSALIITVAMPVKAYSSFRTGLLSGGALTIILALYLLLIGESQPAALTYVGNMISTIIFSPIDQI